MDSVIPKQLQDVIEALEQLPGVGPRTAERYAYFLFKTDAQKSDSLSNAVKNLHANIKYCPKTFALIDASAELSPLYTDPHRNKKLVAVVADPFDVVAIEKTSSFNGTYHVLGGLISPIDNVGPEQLHLDELIDRIKQDGVQELVLATNASVEGESTALLIMQRVEGIKKNLKVTRLARGLPVGVDLDYADQITLTRALEGRQTL